MGFLVTIDKQLIKDKYHDTQFEYVYVLDYRTIGVAPTCIPDWERAALYRETIGYLETENAYIIELPDCIVNFYRITERKYEINVIDNLVLITITDRNKQ